jgi:hypothetical protein
LEDPVIEGRTHESTRLELSGEYSWFLSVAGAIAAAALCCGSICVARGAWVAALCALVVAALTVSGLAAWHTSKRVVFEHDGQVLRGYRVHFGRRTPEFEHRLSEMRDIGLVVEGEQATSSVVAILDSGESKKLDAQFFHVHTMYDEQLRTLRDWFLQLRYAGTRPADLESQPPCEVR